MGFLIDSNIFIAAARGRFSLPKLAADFGNAPMAIATITILSDRKPLTSVMG